jgi:hypothetical protein
MAQDIMTRKNLFVRIIEDGLHYNERILVYYRKGLNNKMIIDMDMIIGQDRIKKMNQEHFFDWEEFIFKHQDSLPEFNYWQII